MVIFLIGFALSVTGLSLLFMTIGSSVFLTMVKLLFIVLLIVIGVMQSVAIYRLKVSSNYKADSWAQKAFKDSLYSVGLSVGGLGVLVVYFITTGIIRRRMTHLENELPLESD
jgi:hypothetical protein